MSRRTERVADALRDTLAEILLREVKDPRVGRVTLTRVTVTPDLRHARVGFSVLGEEAERQRVLNGLRSASGFLRRELTRRLDLRAAPDLVFEYDSALADEVQVTALLRKCGGDSSEP